MKKLIGGLLVVSSMLLGSIALAANTLGPVNYGGNKVDSAQIPVDFTIEDASYIAVYSEYTYGADVLDGDFDLTVTQADLLDGDAKGSATDTVVTNFGTNFDGFASAKVTWLTTPSSTSGDWSIQLDGWAPPTACPVNAIQTEHSFLGVRNTDMRVILNVNNVDMDVDRSGDWNGNVVVTIAKTQQLP